LVVDRFFTCSFPNIRRPRQRKGERVKEERLYNYNSYCNATTTATATQLQQPLQQQLQQQLVLQGHGVSPSGSADFLFCF
jgi:hypothetical protein